MKYYFSLFFLFLFTNSFAMNHEVHELTLAKFNIDCIQKIIWIKYCFKTGKTYPNSNNVDSDILNMITDLQSEIERVKKYRCLTIQEKNMLGESNQHLSNFFQTYITALLQNG
ncbi:hypothetical protein M1446_00495 [Candidatus Dependentiae bacterium]|nr:hypothetical protein [Candidatus Dependentiae bacterium]